MDGRPPSFVWWAQWSFWAGSGPNVVSRSPAQSLGCSFGWMARRIEVELTSKSTDDTWTWRAAGAREPRGTLPASLLYEGAKVGEIVRVEADFGIDGITILQVSPPKTKRAKEPERLEIKAPSEPTAGVTTSLVGRRERPRRDGEARRGRDGGAPGRRDRGDRPTRPASGHPGQARGDRPGGERPGRPDRAGRQEVPQRSGPRSQPESRTRPAHRPDRPERGDQAERRGRGPVVRNVHRAAALAALPPEQVPVAEQLLKGGLPAVRQALEAQNVQARAEGRPDVAAEPIMTLAEQLLPGLKTAAWRDRAESAAGAIDQIPLRELRSIVAGSDVARDDETRALAATLRAAMDRRVSEGRQRWVDDIGRLIDEGRIVRALRLSARAPDPAARFPAELAVKLSQAASAALAPDAPSERWLALLEAVASSPVRRTVHPSAMPAEADDALLATAKQLSGKIPALAALLGIDMPPPPGPPRTGAPSTSPRPPKPPARGRPGGRPSPAPSAPASAETKSGAGSESGHVSTGEPSAPEEGAVAAPEVATAPEKPETETIGEVGAGEAVAAGETPTEADPAEAEGIEHQDGPRPAD